MIKVKNLTFDYPGKRALDDVSFTIEPNTITALVGPNGAGKTTLLRCLAALEPWTLGHIEIDGIDVEHSPRELHKICHYLSDFFGLYDELTVEQSLTFIAMGRGGRNVEPLCLDAAKKVQLMDYYDKPAGSLSRGLRQRLAIAQSIVVPPKLLILDEPASGLDPKARHQLSSLLLELKNQGMTIIVSSHILSELEDYSTHMLKISEGKIVKQCQLDEIQSVNNQFELVLSESPEAYLESLQSLGFIITSVKANTLMVELSPTMEASQVLKLLVNHNIPVVSFSKSKQTMTEVYLSDGEHHD